MVLITGGQRSGKSAFALNYCEERSDSLLFLATCNPKDKELENRIKHHQNERKNIWNLLEESKNLSTLEIKSEIVLVDCVTLWLTNVFFDLNESVEESLIFVKSEIDELSKVASKFVWVTNEIGLGVIPANSLSRKFCDLQGWVNQYLASKCNSAYFLISGIPQKIK